MDRNLRTRLETQQDPRMKGNEKSGRNKRPRAIDQADPRMPSTKTERAAAGHPSEVAEAFEALSQLRRDSDAECAELRKLLGVTNDRIEKLTERLVHVESVTVNAHSRLDELDKSLGVKSGTGGSDKPAESKAESKAQSKAEHSKST